MLKLKAVSNAIREVLGQDFTLEQYTQHALEERSTSSAASYVSVRYGDRAYWGVGIHKDIIESSVLALVSAINRMLRNAKQ